jgi:dTDP-4-amino-4,6-dideoxy-D-galactose acyltransferase
MGDYRILQWDSDFFGFTVANILSSSLNARQLSNVLSKLKKKDVKLVYWKTCHAGSNDFKDNIEKLGGTLVDKKTTFFVELGRVSPISFTPAAVVESYHSSMSQSQLRMLAIQSGKYSRFAVDPNIPREKYIELYTIWIERSLKKELADEVLVICDDGIPAGMVTLSKVRDRGKIELVAVDKQFRGRRYGETLIHAANEWFLDMGYKFGQVVTQGANAPACNLYIKCDYKVEKVEPFYHFWI